MSGGDVITESREKRPEPDEGEELMRDVEEREEGEAEGEEEGGKVRGEEQTKGEAVLEKVEPGMQKG